MTTTTDLPAPTETAVQAYDTAVEALRLVDALTGGRDGNGTDVDTDAHDAATVALRASLAAFLVITCPGGERDYYAAAATELYADMFGEGRGVAESLGVFLTLGFQHADPFRAGHQPYTEDAVRLAAGPAVRGACTCGWYGPDRPDIEHAEADALGHAEWEIVPPVMMVPTGK
jgi:hypothetical protein